MPLSPDECKWSERLTPMQQRMRCGFTGTCVSEMSWSGSFCLLRGRSACVHPTSPWTLTSSHTYRAPHRKKHQFPQGANECGYLHSKHTEYIFKKKSLSCARQLNLSCPVHATSSLPSIRIHGVWVKCHHGWRVCWLLSFSSCCHGLASWTPTHVGLHTPLQMKYIACQSWAS